MFIYAVVPLGSLVLFLVEVVTVIFLVRREFFAMLAPLQLFFTVCLLFLGGLCLALNAKNGNSLWVDAISKDLEDFKVAFMIIPDGKKAPIGHQFVQYHMIFDIRKRGFQM